MPFKDECGVFGVCDSQDAANIAYLGLYALQHRGQESAGIATLDEGRIAVEREMGYVADVFNEARLSRLPGRTAIGHVRYSTAGASLLVNAQPIVFATGRGPLALAHNGNRSTPARSAASLMVGRDVHDDIRLGDPTSWRGPGRRR
jgi:amidophosphoribosyltransferase